MGPGMRQDGEVTKAVNLAREVMCTLEAKLGAGRLPSALELAALKYARAHLDRVSPLLPSVPSSSPSSGSSHKD